jgi:hypothetical protein
MNYFQYSHGETSVTVLGSFPASTDTLESEGRQMKQCFEKYKNFLIKNGCKKIIHPETSALDFGDSIGTF